MSSQYPIESVGKSLPVGLRHRCCSGHLDTAGTHGVHKVPDVQTAPDILLREGLAAWAEREPAFLDDFGSQGNITGDDKITRLAAAYDFVVGNVKAGFHLQESNVGGGWDTHTMVRDQGERESRALGRPEQDLLDHHRTRIGIDPDLQERSRLRSRASPDAFLRAVYQTRWTSHAGIGVHIAQFAVDLKPDPFQQRLWHGGNGLVR